MGDQCMKTSSRVDVVIVGGGPVGTMLACELKLAGIDAVVLEQLAAPTGLSKALGIQGMGVELLELRGLFPRFGQELSMHAHFARIPLDLSQLKGRLPKYLFVLQAHTERVLEEWAQELGVDLRRGHTFVSFTQDDAGVTIEARSPQGPLTLHSRFLVGCDGGHSQVRSLAKIGFPGLEPTNLLRLGDVKFDGEVSMGPRGVIFNGKPAPFGFGLPLGDGYCRVVTQEPLPEGFDRTAPMELDELKQSVQRLYADTTPPIREARWLSRFTDASRQAENYRMGRVLLAGDSAHIHLPAGGPGLSTGLNDAANLGWKLASVLQGRVPDSLLDTYHTERHLAGSRVLLHTRAQGALLSNKTPQIAALRTLLTELFSKEQAVRFATDLLQGLDVRYDMGQPDAPDAVGKWAPSSIIETDEGPRALSALLHPPRGLLLDASNKTLDWSKLTGRVNAVRVLEGPSLLIRPDGFVAWQGPGPGFEEAVVRWFGSETHE